MPKLTPIPNANNTKGTAKFGKIEAKIHKNPNTAPCAEAYKSMFFMLYPYFAKIVSEDHQNS